MVMSLFMKQMFVMMSPKSPYKIDIKKQTKNMFSHKLPLIYCGSCYFNLLQAHENSSLGRIISIRDVTAMDYGGPKLKDTESQYCYLLGLHRILQQA